MECYRIVFSRNKTVALLNDRNCAYLNKTCTKLSPIKYCHRGVQRLPFLKINRQLKNVREGVSQGPHLSLGTYRQLVVGNKKGVRSPRISSHLIVAVGGVV